MRSTAQALIVFTLLLPVALYYWLWDYYALNIPKWDDHALKAFLIQAAQADSASAFWQSVLAQHNEHRIGLTRLFAWLDYAVFERLNYRHLMFGGNLLLVSLLPLLGMLLAKHKKPLFALLPIPFLWLTLSHWENMYWGMAAIQNFGVVVLAIWTFYALVQQERGWFVLALVLGAVTAYTSGNGLVVWPIAAFVLLLNKAWKRALVWSAAGVLLFVVYFSDYVKPEGLPKTPVGFLSYVKGFFYFLGSAAEVMPLKSVYTPTLILGILLFLVSASIVVGACIRMIRNRYEQPIQRQLDGFVLAVLLFVLATSLVVVLSRASFGIEGLLTSRYKIYSITLLVITYVYVVIPIRGSFLSPYVSGMVLLSGAFCVFSYHYHLVDAFNLRKFLVTNAFNWSHDPTAPASKADTLVAQTPFFYSKWEDRLSAIRGKTHVQNPAFERTVKEDIRLIKKKDGYEAVSLFFKSQLLQDSGVYLLLSSTKRDYLLPAIRYRNPSRKEILLEQKYFKAGFTIPIPFGEIAQGSYGITYLYQEGPTLHHFASNDSLEIPRFTAQSIQTNW